MRSLFVHNSKDLDAEVPGGVQICSREFLKIVQIGSIAVQPVAVAISKRLTYRIRRRLGMGTYLLYCPSEWKSALSDALEKFQPTHVFLNRAELLRLSPLVKRLRPAARVVLMSHGNQTGDDLYEVSGTGGGHSKGISKLIATAQLGFNLVTESQFRRRYLDAVCVMSTEESVMERWLGAHCTIVLPRIVTSSPLDWQPVAGRIGYVGTLDHTPNYIALEQICLEMQKQEMSEVELRLIGRPTIHGEALAHKYRFVKYLGALNNEEMKKEAATWSLFLNPIFWLSRGASMKLGQALSWGLPILSTKSGARGYELPENSLEITSDNPGEFVRRLVLCVRQIHELSRIREQAAAGLRQSPSLKELAERLRIGLMQSSKFGEKN